MRHDAGDGAHGAQRADGQGRSADERQGPARRRLRAGACCRPRRRSAIGTLTIAGMAMAFARDGHGPRRRLVHRRGRLVARRVARGDQPLRRAQAAGHLLRAEQPDRALDAGARDSPRCACSPTRPPATASPAITIDGTDPDAIAAAFAWAAERARAGAGPALIELVAMRMCGHAHHDDMLYLGKDPQPSWAYPPLHRAGLRRPRRCTSSGRRAIRSPRYAARLEARGRDRGRRRSTRCKREAEALVEAQARAVIDAPWPDAGERRRRRASPTSRRARASRCSIRRAPRATRPRALPPLEAGPPVRSEGQHVPRSGDARRRRRAARRPARVRLRRRRRRQLRQRLPAAAAAARRSSATASSTRRSPRARSSASASGAALAGQRPIGEMQFNDFVATGFNQLVNNAAKIRYRWGGSVPMVVRMPWGGLRHAGPYHSQNTEPWFYRTPGLKIVVPSTPHDARALMAAAVADPDPVLYYEHIALYRDPRIKQALPATAPAPLPIGKAALRRARRRSGDHLLRRVRARGAARRRAAGRRRHRGGGPRPALARAARPRRACSPSRGTAAGC